MEAFTKELKEKFQEQALWNAGFEIVHYLR